MGNVESFQKSPEQVNAERQEAQAYSDKVSAAVERQKEEEIKRLKKEQAEKEPQTSKHPAEHQHSGETALDRDKVNVTTQKLKPIPIRAVDSSQESTESASDTILQSFKPRKEPRDAIKPKQTSSNTNLAPAKRSASTASVYGDERRSSATKLPKIAKKTSIASPQSLERIEGDQLSSVGDERPPKWYKDLDIKKYKRGNNSNAETLLRSLRDQVKKGQVSAHNGVIRQEVADQIRDKVHKCIFLEVSGEILKFTRMLHNEEGLSQLFDDRFNKAVEWPYDIKADAEELYNKWSRRVFETDLFRGIAFMVKSTENKRDGTKSGDSIDPNYKGVVSAKYHGNGDLLNGQWWPTQLCALRDGAHGSSQGGISGRPGDGAYSVVMSGGHDYEDVDNGEEVLYCGTDSDNGAVTDLTRLMLDSVNNHPVRLIRSHNLKSKYAPELGFRYDGLYHVVSSENLDASNSLRQRHRFRLERQQGQDPIRGGNGSGARPTEEEILQFNNHRRFSGKGKA